MSLGEVAGSRRRTSAAPWRQGEGLCVSSLSSLLVPVCVTAWACISWVTLLAEYGETSKQFVLSPC